MTNSSQSLAPESRRQKLDDLFGDEPFLSPTMKARRLHEKTAEYSQEWDEAAESGLCALRPALSALIPQVSSPVLPGMRFPGMHSPVEAPNSAQTREALASPRSPLLGKPGGGAGEAARVFTSSPSAPQPRTPRMPEIGSARDCQAPLRLSLKAAAAYLQAGPKRPADAGPGRVRREVLLQWLEHVPEREVCSSAEEPDRSC